MRFEPTDVSTLVPTACKRRAEAVSTDGKTFYAQKNRPGQKFASGNPLTAADAAFSLQRVSRGFRKRTPVFPLSQLRLDEGQRGHDDHRAR